MKRILLRKIWIVMLALLPVSMAVKTDVTAAEIISDAEETDPVETGEETILPEETDPVESGEETILPEETDPVESGEETILPEETDPVESGEETILPEETDPVESGEETILPEETDPVESGEETILPEETDPVENGEETVLAEEVDLPEEEQEIPAAGDTEAAAAVPAEAEDEIAGEEETVSNAGAAALMESMVETQLYDRIHYISLDDYYAASDSILIESNGHFGLVDTSHPSWDQDSRISGYTVDVDNVIEYLHRVGVMHLDFVLGTHAHSDHIGGMKFLAAALNAEGNYWIDSSTVYFYKQYYYNSLEEDDWEWQNTRMFRQAVEAMTERGAIMVETSSHDAQALEKANAVFIKGDSDPVSDSIAFTIGNLAVSLFNLYHNSSDNENLNSIVAAVTKDERTTLLMGDLEMEDGYERKVANTVAAKYGNADVIKLGHHGYDECTSSDTLRTLEPSYVVTTSNRTRNYYDDEPPFSYFLAHRGITAYRAAEATYALVEELSGEDIRFYTYDSSGGLTKDPVEWKARMTSGWKKWNRDDGTYDYIFVRSDGSAATGWNYLTMNGEASWYLFDQDGINLRGFQKDGQYTYYLNTKGEMQTGWQKVGGKWYYMNGSGAMQTGWQKLDGKWYYMNSSGVMQTGWVLADGKWYYMDDSGAMKTGWQQIGGKWYYMNESGVMLTGWQRIGGKWYYMNGSGAMQTGWVLTGGKWYYMNGSGVMLTGWQKIGGKWYYMNGSGAMQTGWQKIGGKWYYMNSSGAMQTGWVWTGGKWYYMNSSGVMLTGWQKIGGKWYYMDSSGAMQ